MTDAILPVTGLSARWLKESGFMIRCVILGYHLVARGLSLIFLFYLGDSKCTPLMYYTTQEISIDISNNWMNPAFA
jgi:hypothetical protein